MLLKGPSTAVCFSQKQKENFLCVFCTAQIFQGVWLCFSRYWRGQYSAHLPIILVFFHKRSHPWNFSPLILRQGDISVAAPYFTYFFSFSSLSIFLGKCECGKWLYDSVTWMWNRGRLRSSLTVQHGSLSPRREQILRFQRILFFVASYLMYNNRRLTSYLIKYCQTKKSFKICKIYLYVI